jgi:hypothetical protein
MAPGGHTAIYANAHGSGNGSNHDRHSKVVCDDLDLLGAIEECPETGSSLRGRVRDHHRAQRASLDDGRGAENRRIARHPRFNGNPAIHHAHAWQAPHQQSKSGPARYVRT